MPATVCLRGAKCGLPAVCSVLSQSRTSSRGTMSASKVYVYCAAIKLLQKKKHGNGISDNHNINNDQW